VRGSVSSRGTDELEREEIKLELMNGRAAALFSVFWVWNPTQKRKENSQTKKKLASRAARVHLLKGKQAGLEKEEACGFGSIARLGLAQGKKKGKQKKETRPGSGIWARSGLRMLGLGCEARFASFFFPHLIYCLL